MDWTTFVPYERLQINTYLSQTEIEARLDEVVEPKKLRWAFFSRDHKPYQGTFNTEKFDVSRIIHYRNSFLPMIKGRISTDMGQTRIDITMQLHIFVIAFMIVWFGFVGMFSFGLFGAFLFGGETAPEFSFLFAPLPFFIFGYCLTTLPFKYEARKSRQFFQDLFNDNQL